MRFTLFSKILLASNVALTFVSYVIAQESFWKPAKVRVIDAAGGMTKREVGRIAGLLSARQQLECDPGFGLCPNSDICCPTGGRCCPQQYCCDPGQFCLGGGFCCLNSQRNCEGNSCCDPGESCCKGGGCCDADHYCAVGDNGVVGCCQNGRICSGNAPPPPATTVPPPPPPPPPTTTTRTRTSTSTSTSTRTTDTIVPPTSTSSTISASTPTSTGSSGGGKPFVPPPPPAGSKSVIVAWDDVKITWKGEWETGTSSCDSTSQSRKTSTSGQSFMYTISAASMIYLNVATRSTYFSVYINDVATTYTPNDSRVANCTYGWSSSLSVDFTYNITVLVYGATPTIQSDSGDSDWSFEFNNFAIAQPVSGSSASLPNSTTASNPFGSPSSSSSEGRRLNYSGVLCGLMVLLAIFVSV